MNIIAIDLSYRKPVALAYMTDHRQRAPKVLSVTPAKDILGTVFNIDDEVGKLALGRGDVLVVVETPLMIRNMNTSYVMARMHGMLELWAREFMGWKFFGIHPMTWQSKTFKVGKGVDLKAESKKVACAVTGMSTLNEDEADAINLCVFAQKNLRGIMRAIRGGEKFSEK